MRRAAVVLDAPARVLEVTFGVNHADIAERPVRVKMWLAGRRVLATTLTTADRRTVRFPVPEGASRVLLETRVNRAIVPSEHGVPDNRQLGLLVKWAFRGSEEVAQRPQ